MNFAYDYFENRDRDPAVEHRLSVLHQVDVRYVRRDMMEPFRISVSEFRRLYRVPQHVCLELAETLSPYFPVHRNSTAIEVPIRVLCALAFFASGSYQRVVGRDCSLSLSETTVSDFIAEVTTALNHPNVMLRYIHFSDTPAERELVIERNKRLGLPRMLGFTLVKIVPPPLHMNREAFYCRKGYTALNVQIVCDASLRIFSVNSRYPGSCNGPFIYRNSGVREERIEAYRSSRCWLLGDSIYPHEPWFHNPLPNAEDGTPEYIYTRLHCHCRNACERCIGVLKGSWRCLLHDRTLHYRPAKAGLIVNACAVLHNICISRNVPDPEFHPRQQDDDVEHDEDYDVDFENLRWIRARADEERRFLIDYAVRHRRID